MNFGILIVAHTLDISLKDETYYCMIPVSSKACYWFLITAKLCEFDFHCSSMQKSLLFLSLFGFCRGSF